MCRNIPLPLIRLLQTDTDSTMKFWGYYYEYSYFKDNRLTEEAEEAMKNLLSVKNTIPSSLWKVLKIDTAPVPKSPCQKHAFVCLLPNS